MKQVIPVLCGIAVSVVGGRADAALTWVDGNTVKTQAFCGATGYWGDGSAFRSGYITDPVQDGPKLYQVFYVHAMAVNASCVGNGELFEFQLPQGAHLAISSTDQVQCFLDGQRTNANCSQQALQGINGLAFQQGQQLLAPGHSWEVQIPVWFDQVVDRSTLNVVASDAWETKNVGVAMTVPFQPTLLAGTRGQDLALVGSSLPEQGTLPMAFANDDGSFTVTNYPVGDFAAWSRAPGVQRLSGDFNGDGLTDYALIGGPGWRSIPIAISLGDGRFWITNNDVGDFDIWASTPNVKVLTGDFNRDGRTDIALVGGATWGSIPVAFSTNSNDGHFSISNWLVPNFASWAAGANVKPLTGDFNRDGMTDIALVGGAGWSTLPVAFSYGNGQFQVTNYGVSTVFNGVVHTGFDFALSTQEPGAKVVTGDFNADGFTDLAVTGGTSFTGIRIALSLSGGMFRLYESPDANFGPWARSPGVKVVTGDFNRDGATDIALTGVAGWQSIPVATSIGGSFFAVSNVANPAFAQWASQPGVRVISGDFNGDGYGDIALTGGAGWGSIPVGLGVGSGFFAVTSWAVKRFPGWATDASATVLVGQSNYY